MEGSINNVQDLIVFRLGSVNKMLFNRGNKMFMQNNFPIDMSQIPVLMFLYYTGNKSQQEMADELVRDKSSVQRTIGFFVKHNLVEVASDPFDKRKNIVRITKEGKRLAGLIENEMFKTEETMFACLSESEKKSLVQLLRKIELHNPIK